MEAGTDGEKGQVGQDVRGEAKGEEGEEGTKRAQGRGSAGHVSQQQMVHEQREEGRRQMP